MFNFIHLLFVVGNAFNLLPNYTPPKNNLHIKPCFDINPIILETTIQVCEALSDTGLIDINVSDLGTVNICTHATGHYGSFSPVDNEIRLNEIIQYFPNMSYNVILHEILHSLGLDHTDKPGMMSYSIREYFFGYPIEDQNKLWLSVDDVHGVLLIKYAN
jgi:hypothetical protein